MQSFSQLFLSLLIIINSFQGQNCSDLCHDDNKIYRQLYTATNRTLSSMLSPVCFQVLLNQNNIQSQYISSQGLTGRILPVGTFPTEASALEYLYGILCPIANLQTRQGLLQSFDLVHVAYDKKYLITQSEFIFNLTNNTRLTFFASMAFDKDYKLCGYNGQVRNFGLTLDTYTDAEHQEKINIICAVTQRFCNGTLQQYASVNDCIQYLTTKVPYGSLDRADQGNVACRIIHANFVPLFPSIHCPHIGPTGGGICTDKTLDSYYDQLNFLTCAAQYK